jgi:autotransporter-associated beta strand protein/T5SS/PEP-CTERM-associated repeat protein
MKKTTNIINKALSFIAAAFINQVSAAVIAGWVLCLSLATSYSADNLWTGVTSTDWNDGTNWAEGGVPDTAFDENAVVSTTTPNIATITADILYTPNDINVTGGGRIDHQAGIAGTFGGAWMNVGMDSTPSFYNLADTSTTGLGISGYTQGSGTLNATGNLNLAAWGGNRNGTMNINTTGALNVTGTLRIGNDGGSVGVMNLESGSVILSHTGWGADETHIGHGGGIATLNIAGGSFSASRNFRLGNDRGTGTLNITGGSLTVAGTDDVFIGRDKGTAIVNQSGGVVEFNHNTFIANGNNQSDPTSGTYNLSAGVLNVKREFVIGREGVSATGTLNMTGGTITKTGDEKMIVGHNNGKGFVVQSGGTINVNNELFIGNENAGASGTYTLSGSGALNVANELVVGRESGAGTLNVNGGTIITSGNGSMYVGRRNGTGTLNQTDGMIVVNKEFGVGTRDDNKIGTGTYNLSGGSIAVANNFFVGKELGSSGTLNMSGGTLGTSDRLQIGHNQATGVLTQSGGIVNVQNEVYIGNENNASSVGTYTLSGSAVLNVGNEVQVGRDNGTGTLNLSGGTVNAIKILGGNGSATVNFNGGVIKAKRDESNLIENLDTANVESGGAKINSNGFNVATSQVLTGTGGLEKLGAGSLTLSANNTYAGTTTVSEGLLKVNGSVGSVTVSGGGSLLVDSGGIVGSTTVGGGTLLVSGTAGATTVNSGTATVNSGGTIGSATINGSLLSVNGSAGDVIVNSGGTLGGSGSVQGLTLNGGTVTPGNSPGLLTAYELNGSNGTFQFQLGASTTRGTTYDAINVSTLLTLGASTAWTFEVLDNYVFSIGDSYDLFNFGSIDATGFDITKLDIALPTLSSNELVWDTTSFTTDGLVSVVSNVPEPSALQLFGIGLISLLACHRINKRNG